MLCDVEGAFHADIFISFLVQCDATNLSYIATDDCKFKREKTL